jgi:hypothetical protein
MLIGEPHPANDAGLDRAAPARAGHLRRTAFYVAGNCADRRITPWQEEEQPEQHPPDDDREHNDPDDRIPRWSLMAPRTRRVRD